MEAMEEGGEGEGSAPAERRGPLGALPSKKVSFRRLWIEIFSKENGHGGMPGWAVRLLARRLALANAKVGFKVFSLILFVC